MSMTRYLITFVLCSLSSVALAETDPKVEAALHFDRGLSSARDGAYAESIAEFTRAYQISPHFAVMFNLGQAYMALGKPVSAVEALTRYLGDGGQRVPPARRKQVQADIAKQETLIATVTLSCNLTGAVVSIDGVRIGVTPLPAPLLLDNGAHVFAATAASQPPWEQQMRLVGKQQTTVEIRFAQTPLPVGAAPAMPIRALAAPVARTTPGAANPSPASVQLAPVQSMAFDTPGTATATPKPGPSNTESPVADLVSSPASNTPGSRRTIAYAVGGMGVGALVVGAVFGLRAFSKAHDSDSLCPQERCSREGVTLNNQAKTAALVSDFTFGVGLVSVAISTYLLLTSAKATSPVGTTLAHRIRIAPKVGPGSAGITLRGAW
jgi:hypothetical protein